MHDWDDFLLGRIKLGKSITEIRAADVLEIVALFERNGVDLWIDGGWGVDALLGEQTRPHSDLDIAVHHEDLPRIRALLESIGFMDVPRPDTRDCNFVLSDSRGRQIDVHSFVFDENGNNIYGIEYPFDSLTGHGSVNGYPVKCITPEWMVKFHTGYEPDWDDYRDVLALCERFNIELPSVYEKFADDRRMISRRLVYQPVSLEALDEFHSLIQDEHVQRYLLDGEIFPREWSADRIADSEALFNRRGVGIWLVREKVTAELVGFCGFLVIPSIHLEPQLVYAMFKRFTGRGHATEMARIVIAKARAQQGFESIYASVDEVNAASVRVLEKLGFRQIESRQGAFGNMLILQLDS